jgi:tetratricopeptide (TPR) repeat protein
VLQTALEGTKKLGHRAELPGIYHSLGNTTLYLGRYAEARATYATGLAAAQAVSWVLDISAFLFGLTMAALAEGDHTEARALAEEAITISTRTGEEFALGVSLTLGALADRRLGEHTRARASIVIALRLVLPTGSPMHWAFWVVALLLADGGAPTRAAEAFALAEQNRREDNIWTQDIALREIGAVVAALPPHVAAATQARWVGRDIYEAGYELLAELEADGWGAGL